MTNITDGCDALQEYTLSAAPRPPVNCGEVHTENAVTLYGIVTAVQKTTAKWWPNMKSAHDDYQDGAEMPIARKLMKSVGNLPKIIGLGTPLRTSLQLATHQVALSA